MEIFLISFDYVFILHSYFCPFSPTIGYDWTTTKGPTVKMAHLNSLPQEDRNASFYVYAQGRDFRPNRGTQKRAIKGESDVAGAQYRYKKRSKSQKEEQIKRKGRFSLPSREML